jgi:hypothetical protein
MDSKEPQPAPESKNPFVIWLNTKEGLNCVQPADFTKPGSVRFLENRLWYAYTAGLSEQLRVSISEISTLQKTIEEQKKEIDGHANKFRELQGLIERYRKIEEYDSNKCGNHVYNEIMEHLAKHNL